MKRCPQCLFIYPDSDARCDFDNTPLVVVDEAELEAATSKPERPAKRKPATKKRQRKKTVTTAVGGLILDLQSSLGICHAAQIDAAGHTGFEPM